MADIGTYITNWLLHNYIVAAGAAVFIITITLAIITLLRRQKRATDLEDYVKLRTKVYDQASGLYDISIDWGTKPPGIPFKYPDGAYYYEVELRKADKAKKPDPKDEDHDNEKEDDLTKYHPLPQPIRGKSPKAWYRALHDLDVARVFPVPSSIWEKLGIIEGFIFIGILVILLLVQ